MTDQELNEAIARKLGWTKHQDGQWNRSHELGGEVVMFGAFPDYCGSIQAAWEIVEHVQKRWIVHVMGGLNGKYWHCDMRDHPAVNKVYVSESADTASRAICEAFLKLKE